MEKRARWYEVVGSVFAAMFGVQSRSNHVRDFAQSSPWAYVVGGLLFAVLFVLTLYGVVQWVLAKAGL